MKKNLSYFFICLFISLIAFMGFKLNGFCAVALSPSSISQFQSFSSAMAQSGMGFNVAPPEIAITELLNNINYNLYEVYGYDLMDLSNDVWNSISDPTEWYNNLTKYASGEYTVDGSRVDVSVADRIAQRISQGALTGAVTAKNLLDAGYRYFSTSVPQWGNNAKQFIIGKVDEATQQIVDVSPTMVTKITSEGLVAYNQIYNNLINDNSISNLSNSNFYYGTNYKGFFRRNISFYNFQYEFNTEFPFYLYIPQENYYGYKRLYIVISESVKNQYFVNDLDNGYGFVYRSCASCSGKWINLDNSSFRSASHIYIRNFNELNTTLGKYYYGSVDLLDDNFNSISIGTNFSFSSLDIIQNNLHASPSVSLSYDYSSSALSQALKDQLDRLIGKYVDSITLGRINDIVQSIPIGQELVGETDIPVAIPTQEVVDELTNVIDDALELDEDYAIAFDDAYASEIETTPDPQPYPNNSGTAVPEDFPEAPIFDPLVDIVKIPFSFFSIFEPIFQVFGASFNFFTVWLCFPVILIILLIIWALK